MNKQSPVHAPRRAFICGALAVLALFIFAQSAHAQTRTIVIDAGHGGYDRGGVPYQRIGEKNLTLDVAQRLAAILRGDGYRVVMTRNSDVFVSLGERVAIANSYRNATFVSIHFNSASRGGANGIETYYYRSDAAGLAASIHRNVVAGAPSENRGIRRRGYFVLRRTNIPAVLVECGFLTNPTEGNYALNAGYRQKLAQNIARGILREPAPFVRPLARGAAASVEVLPQPFNGPDFVKAAPRPRRVSSRHGSSHHKKSSTTHHKKSSSSKKKKKKTKSSED
ncbi:MAG: N-acetylmuramoyl-L-alanine amidase [Verrucomicrobiota bacterium]|nr:N-acetylmuramoyl-L-alanine amidase [Verrucomicrobiota bacterium]